jgi:hypothetical protein
MSEEILDGKSTIELNLDKELLFDLMLMAHERDITLNQLIEEALREFIKQYDVKQYEADDGALTKSQMKQIKKMAKKTL